MNVEQDLHCTSALTAVPTSNNECIHQPEIHNCVKSKMQPRQSDEIKKKTLESLTLFCRFNKPHPSLEFPPLYFVLERFPEIREGIKAFYAWRWNISYPLQKRVPGSQFLRYFRIYLTYGEIVLLIALTALPSVCVYYTLVAPSVSGTGKAARLAVIAALLFAQRTLTLLWFWVSHLTAQYRTTKFLAIWLFSLGFYMVFRTSWCYNRNRKLKQLLFNKKVLEFLKQVFKMKRGSI
ncbi:hypothetical protein ACA910_010530 [Epithemia clementina (nom. ined.)]